jgi:hypothetical protein
VLTVSVVVAFPPAPGVTAPALQVGAGVTTGVMAQEKLTLELNAPMEVTVSEEVAEPPGVTEGGVKALAARSKVGTRLNVAVTVSPAFKVCEQVPVPEQLPPLQPANVDPAAGVGVRTTVAPRLKPAWHAAGQSMRPGMPLRLLVTEPVPEPANVTESFGINVAVTLSFTVKV